LNRRPVLKSFLKDGEAESYANVSVRFVTGRPAILTLYDDRDSELEKIDLSRYTTKEELHELLQSKGFRRRQPSSEEIAKTKEREVIQLDPIDASREANHHQQNVVSDREVFKPFATSKHSTTVIIGALISLLLFYQARKRWKRPRQME
jgi:Sep15/SelM redox domain